VLPNCICESCGRLCNWFRRWMTKLNLWNCACPRPCVWPCIFIMFIPTNFSLFFALLADVQLITDNVYTSYVIYCHRYFLSSSFACHCRVRCVVHLKLVHIYIYSVVCFGEQKNFLIGHLKLSFGLGMMFILLDIVTESIKYWNVLQLQFLICALIWHTPLKKNLIHFGFL